MGGKPHSWMVLIRETPNLEMDDDLGVPLFEETPIYINHPQKYDLMSKMVKVFEENHKTTKERLRLV